MLIDRRFCGPPDSANGGYVAGLAAAPLSGDVQVTLRQPPPLQRPLTVRLEGHRVVLSSGDAVVAEAAPASLDLDLPEPVTVEDAVAASTGYIWASEGHPFPTCFVCGPARSPGDGLRLFPGPVNGGPLAAAPWMPDGSLAGTDQRVLPEFVWAALDCPSYFGAHATDPGTPWPAVLGRITARVEILPRVGERLTVAGWGLERSGRKIEAASALFSARGEVCAVARSTWIALA